jgi:hypothetical protein
MKKLVVLSAVLALMVSCKKNYDCVCDGGKVATYHTRSKSDAQAQCDLMPDNCKIVVQKNTLSPF